MIVAVSIAGLCLLALGLADTRARYMALILALVWLETALFDLMASVDMAIAMRPLIDFCGAIMALGVVTRERWSKLVPALFAVMMLCHSAYWLAWHNGVDLWYAYPHALNALWLCQLAAVAWPGGGQLVGVVGAWLSRVFNGWRSNAVLVPWEQKARAIGSYRQDDVGACSDVYLPFDKRA